MPRIIKSSKLGDAAILKEIIKILKLERISTINSLTFNPELTLKKGTYSKVKPNKEDKKNIKKAILTLNGLGKYTLLVRELSLEIIKLLLLKGRVELKKC